MTKRKTKPIPRDGYDDLAATLREAREAFRQALDGTQEISIRATLAGGAVLSITYTP